MRLLLTSSQVSVILSASIICLFTFVLFLAGYVLQQHSIQGLQQSLKPRIPSAPSPKTAPAPLASILKPSRAFGGSPGSSSHIAYQQYIDDAATSSTPTDWTRLAHVQLVRTHHEVCSAIMIFGELHRLKSPAKRVLLFPRAWALEKKADEGEAFDPFMAASRRLLRNAARRYAVELRPIAPIVNGADVEDEGSYSLASVYGLTDYERVLILSTPGLILDATPLDAMLAYAPASRLALLQEDEPAGVNATDLILAMPEAETYDALAAGMTRTAESSDAVVLQTALPEPLVLDAASDDGGSQRLVASISSLHDAAAGFNASAYLSSAAYIRFSDPKLPGPEYDVPYADRVRARPRNKDADWVWTKLYGSFAQKRMDICGLDLEPWYG